MDDPKPKLTPAQRSQWNQFIDFVEMQKMAGNPALDQRNKNVGLMLLNKFNMANPKMQITPDIIPVVQQEIQDYRNAALQKIKAGQAAYDGKEEDFMPNLSVVDGWPGTKTLSTRFPGATLTVATPTGTTTKSYGQDTESYDRDMARNKPQKPIK